MSHAVHVSGLRRPLCSCYRSHRSEVCCVSSWRLLRPQFVSEQLGLHIFPKNHQIPPRVNDRVPSSSPAAHRAVHVSSPGRRFHRTHDRAAAAFYPGEDSQWWKVSFHQSEASPVCHLHIWTSQNNTMLSAVSAVHCPWDSPVSVHVFNNSC